MGREIPFPIHFVGLCFEAEILQDLNLHSYFCVVKGQIWFGALFEGLFHTLERKCAKKNAHF